MYVVHQGASPHARDRYGSVPLDDAARQGHKDIVTLMQSGIEPKVYISGFVRIYPLALYILSHISYSVYPI